MMPMNNVPASTFNADQWWVWVFIGIVIAFALIFFWSRFVQPLLKRQVNIVITGAADELDALADSIRDHQWKMGRGQAVLGEVVKAGRIRTWTPPKRKKAKRRTSR